MAKNMGRRKLLAGVAYLLGVTLLVMAFLPALTADPAATAFAEPAEAATRTQTVSPTRTKTASATRTPTSSTSQGHATLTVTAGNAKNGSTGTGTTSTGSASNVGGAGRAPAMAPTSGADSNGAMPFVLLLGLIFLGAGLALSKLSLTTKS